MRNLTQLDSVLFGNDKIPCLVKTGTHGGYVMSSFSFTFSVNYVRKQYLWACATGVAGVELVC
jgi:hypothetical protein